MKMQIEFDGNETPEQIERVVAAVNAYANAWRMDAFGFGETAPARECGQPQRQTMADKVLESGGFTPAPLTDELLNAQENGGLRAEFNPSHGYTEGMDTPPLPTIGADVMDAAVVFGAEIPFDENGNNYEQPTAGVELDAAGKPWDENIHASSKTKTADGCWKFKRGIDPALRQSGVTLPPPPAPAAIVAQSEPVIPPSPAARIATDTEATVEPIIPPPPVTEAHTLPWLMGQAAKFQKTKADIDAALAACGMRTIPDLLGQLDKMDDVARALGVL